MAMNGNNLKTEDYDEIISSALAQMREAKEKKRIKCLHTPHVGAELIPIMKAKNISMSKEDRAKYPENTVVCSRCGAIIDVTQFSEEQLDGAAFMMRSALAQMQIIVGGRLSSDELSELSSAFVNLEYVHTLLDGFYDQMVKKMRKGNGGNNKPKSNKGGIGLTSAMLRS